MTNIVSMLMVFLIQNTQNRESAAQQLKLDELLRAVRGAQNSFINLEGLSEKDLQSIKERYITLAEEARLKSTLQESNPTSPNSAWVSDLRRSSPFRDNPFLERVAKHHRSLGIREITPTMDGHPITAFRR